MIPDGTTMIVRDDLADDIEIGVIATVVTALAELDEKARRRVLRYLMDRYGPPVGGPVAPLKVMT